MQKFTAILLLFTLLSSNFSRFFVYTGFKINKNYILTSLCENRNKPQLHCNGNCFLMKKIKQADKKEKADKQNSKKNNSQEAFIHTQTALITPFVKCIEPIFTNPTFTYPTKSNTFFQPPQA